MITIMKLRLMKLRDEIKLIGIMTIMTLVMIAVFSSVNYTEEVVVFGFIDDENSELTQMVFDNISNTEGYSLTRYTIEDAKEAVKKDDIDGAFYLKSDFTQQVMSGQVSVEKLLIAENMANMQMDNLLSTAIGQASIDYQISNMLSQIIQQDDVEVKAYVLSAINEHWTYKKPITVFSTTLKAESSYSSIKHSIVGFSLFFAMFTIIFGISDILTDKEYHTWDRTLISPISKFSILSGNLVMTFVLGFVQVSSMFLVSKYLFKVDWTGNMLYLLVVIAAFVFCVTSLGMFLSNFVNSIGQLSAISPVIITGTAMLGGCFWPLEIVTSKPLLLLSNITPQKWAIDAIEKVIIHGYNLDEVILSVAVLVGMGIVYLSLGTYLLEKKSA